MEGSPAIEQSQEGAVLTISLNRPEEHNSLNGQLISELTTTFLEINAESNARIIVLTGKGRSFCAGADLSTFNRIEGERFEENKVEGLAIFDLMMAVANCPLPVVGRINGAAIGGGVGLVSCCDIVVAVERAIFAFSEVRLGLVPAVISPFVIAKIGLDRARELYLTGERFDAHLAKEIGLVHTIVAEEELDKKVTERVHELLLGAPGAQADVKELLDTILYRPISELRDYTSGLFARRWESAEAKEGIKAFLEKRNPDWQEQSK
jgi:methylglutaconyl-CoA hydratase